MEKVVKIFRHVDCEGPGYLVNVLERNGIPYQLIKIDENQSVPTSLDDMLAMVSMGGGMSVNDDLAWIDEEIALMQQANSSGIPVLGHCLGAQLMAKALGATVSANPVKEIGWFEVELTASENAKIWFKDIEFPLSAFHWHGETYSLPVGAENLLSSKNCVNQAFIRGKMIGFQCHIEMTGDLIVEWTQRFSGQINRQSSTEQSPETILKNLDSNIQKLNSAADIFYQRWIDNFINRG